MLVEATNSSVTDTGDGTVDRDIVWDADVVISSGPSPELEINASGAIVKAINVSVDDSAGDASAGASTKTTGSILSNDIVVNNVYNDDPGEAVFDSTGGDVSGGSGTFYFGDTYESVKITNESGKKLVINDIDVVARSGNPKVDITAATDHDNAITLQFDLRRTVASSLIDITNLSSADILFQGTGRSVYGTASIENPIGETRIWNTGGNILSAGATTMIRTNRMGDENVVLPAGEEFRGIKAQAKSIGTLANPINVDLVQSAGRPEQFWAEAQDDV